MMKSSGSRGMDGDRIKYSAVRADDSNSPSKISEKSPLLDNMEKISLSSPTRIEKTENAKEGLGLSKCDKKNDSDNHEVDENTDSKDKSKIKLTDNSDVNKSLSDKNAHKNDHHGARPKFPSSSKTTTETSGESANAGADNRIDIVRKMSQPRSENYVPWRKIGPYQILKQKNCHRLYATSGRKDDLALFYHNGIFSAMEAWCTHMGGPLFEGDIEDYNGKCHVMCPWHSYMFDLKTGMNEIGLQQKVYDLKLEAGQIFVKYHTDVTIEPNRKPSVATGNRVINRPPEGKHDKMRKQSVLDSPLKLA